MNEFRLYWFDKGHHQSLRFTIFATDLLKGTSLIADTDEARFERFLFRKVFHRDTLHIDHWSIAAAGADRAAAF